MTTTDEQLDRTFVVLHEPQDLVNIALVIRAMKNMGLSQLRLVRPAEYDAWRVTGIAHDTEDVVEKVEVFDDKRLPVITFLHVFESDECVARTIVQQWALSLRYLVRSARDRG